MVGNVNATQHFAGYDGRAKQIVAAVVAIPLVLVAVVVSVDRSKSLEQIKLRACVRVCSCAHAKKTQKRR